MAGSRWKRKWVTKAEWYKIYGSYLRSPIWQAKRAIVMKRARGMCERCHENRATQVHHTELAYSAMRAKGFGAESTTRQHLIALCPHCHARAHNRPVEEFLPKRR